MAIWCSFLSTALLHSLQQDLYCRECYLWIFKAITQPLGYWVLNRSKGVFSLKLTLDQVVYGLQQNKLDEMWKRLYDDGRYLAHGSASNVFAFPENNAVLKWVLDGVQEDEIPALLSLQDTPFAPKLFAYGKNYIVMEYVHGVTLEDAIKSGLNCFDSEKFWSQIYDIIFLLASRNLLFADMHKGNIILTPDHRVRLIDFGCCMHFKNHKVPCFIPLFVQEDSLQKQYPVVKRMLEDMERRQWHDDPQGFLFFEC